MTLTALWSSCVCTGLQMPRGSRSMEANRSVRADNGAGRGRGMDLQAGTAMRTP